MTTDSPTHRTGLTCDTNTHGTRPNRDAKRGLNRNAKREPNRLEESCHQGGSHLPRRQFLLGVALATTAGLAGCLGAESDDANATPAEPVALTGGLACDACGMVIEEHYGPAAQAFYADGEPEDREGPARFDSVSELLVSLEEADARGRETRAVFVTDYSSVDYELDARDGTPYISTHAEGGVFADVDEAHFVADSGVHGAMGPDYVPFTDPAEADAFADEHDGAVLEWDELRAR